MSFEFYAKWWAGTKQNLEYLFQKDAQFTKQALKVKDRSLANQLIGGIYAKYSMLVQDLGTILDQMAQPQKRILVRKLMDVATIRLRELHQELTNIDISEYHYIDGALIELKLIPHDVEILKPILYYLRDGNLEDLWTRIKKGERIYTPLPPPPGDQEPGKEEPPKEAEAVPEVMEDVEKKKKRRPKKFVPQEKVLTEEEKRILAENEKRSHIALVIQKMERARSARVYFFEKAAEYQYKKKIRLGWKPESISDETKESSVRRIFQYWQGHCARKLAKQKELEKRYLIGMIEPSWKDTKVFHIQEQNLQKRRDYRDIRIKEYIDAILNETTRIYKVIAPRLMEDIGDEIREWFSNWYTQVKNFDKYPPEEKGGTILVVRGETLTPKEWLDAVEKKRRQKVKDKGKDKEKKKAEKEKQKKLKAELKKKEKEKLKKEKARKKKKKLKPWDFELEMEPTVTKDPLAKALDEYFDLFFDKKDEDNPEERYYIDIIHEEKCYYMQLDVRQIVDEMMRLELELLEDALQRDRGKKRKKKKKKKKKKRKKKKKGKKDITANRTTEDLFQELADSGIIHGYENDYLKNFKGDFSWNNWELRNRGFDPPSCLGDIRHIIKMSCIAPLSTEAMKKPRSVLITGPRQGGKRLLAKAVMTESRSVLFDLSPEILAGKYQGKQGMKMLLHLINKMSRLLQPSVIYLEAAERIFYKKVPAAEKDLDPRRIGKKLVKEVVKKIKPTDRVLVLGISSKPWLGKQGKMKKCFEQVILLPRPDYSSIYLYWRELLMPYHGVDRNINLSCLAKLTQFYPLPVLKEVVEKVMTARRIIQLKYNPLKQSELFEEFVNLNPITDKEYKKYLKFYKKNPLAKERNRLNKYYEKIRELENKAANKGKK